MHMTAEASNSLSFASFTKKTSNLISKYLFLGFIVHSLSDLIKVCHKTTDSFCINISLRSRLQCNECTTNKEKKLLDVENDMR